MRKIVLSCAWVTTGVCSTTPGRSIVAVVPVERRCPNAKFQLSTESDVCLLKEVVRPDLVCREDSKLVENSQCYKEEVFAPQRICPAGSKFNGSECEQNRLAAVNMKCEIGDELVHGECVHIEVHAGKPSCPKGHVVAPGSSSCEAKTFTSPDFVCPTGYLPALESSQLCERLLSRKPESQCPPGTFLHDNMCLSALLEGQIAKRCASGGEMDAQGKCVSVAQVEPDIVCPGGYAFKSGRCEKPSFSEPKYRCPRDFVLQGDTCVQTIPAEAYCSSEEKMTPLGTCVGIEHQDPTRVCPQRSVPGAEGRCVVQVIYKNDLQLSCGDKYALVEGRCMKKIKTIDAVACPTDYELSRQKGVCERRDTIASEPRCGGTGEFDTVTRSCVSRVPTDITVACPRGTEYNPGISRCQSKRIYPPGYSCPEGMQLKKARQGGTPTECVQHIVIPAETTCSGLGEITSKGQCIRAIMRDPEQRCPPNYVMEKDECVHTEKATVVRGCPEGFKHVGNACVGKVPTSDGEAQLSDDDRRALQEVLEGMTNKRSPSFRKTPSEKNKDAALLELIESAKTNRVLAGNALGKNAKQNK